MRAYLKYLELLKNYILRWKEVWGWAMLLGLLLLLGVQTSDVLPTGYFDRRLSDQIGSKGFDLFAWEVQAPFAKLGMEFAAPQDTLNDAQRYRLVADYFDAQSRMNRLREEIEEVYSQFSEVEAAQKAALQERELAELHDWLVTRQNMVEGILEEQTSAALEAEGFGRWGYVLPPVKLRFTELPLLLVVSLRTRITREADVELDAGLSLTEQMSLEENVDRRFEDMRALVTPIGGLSAYPAMILETDSLVWLTDTFAHEWAHHFLTFHPLGYNYDQSGEMTSLNETTASIIGREVGRRVILDYYPAWADRLPALPTPPTCPPMSAGELVWPDEPPADVFSYDREMRQTRLRVDDLLAAGQVDEAERYMEERRQVFVRQGHNIRKLNQAFFAFHGSYATSPSTGNPIGGQLEWLRGQSPSLRDFCSRVASFSRYEYFIAALEPYACGS